MNTRFFTLIVAAIVLTILPSCVEPPPGSESSIWQRPPRYGHNGTDSPKPEERKPARTTPRNPSEDRNSSRFGYSGGDDAPPPADDLVSDANEAPRDRDREAMATDEKPDDKPAAEKPKDEPKKSGPPSVAEMPFAKGVPGKPLSVTLPSPNSHLGEISIEQYEGGKPTGRPLPPGTPVEIPDPGNPGKKIYFKVP
ncbi:MAG: hypothetical protein KDN19_19745 [Verrucomicrobiae bacterium]|nr:hypothetical protein [Verrucomicrobiae bacterium]